MLREVLDETHGVMVYQEQVMRILHRLGGIELASAYTCIKAISKKKEATIAKSYEQFIQGAVERGMAEKDAHEVWELIGGQIAQQRFQGHSLANGNRPAAAGS